WLLSRSSFASRMRAALSFFSGQLLIRRHPLETVCKLAPEGVDILSAGVEKQIHCAMACRTASIQVLDDGSALVFLQPGQERSGNAISLSVGVSIRINRKRKTSDISLEIFVPDVVGYAFLQPNLLAFEFRVVLHDMSKLVHHSPVVLRMR